MHEANAIGKKFEEDLEKEFGLKRVVGSGNQWHSKLDLRGLGARWSLKATKKESISISSKVINEAIRACGDSSGDGSIPVWAFRIGDGEHDIIALRKEDFILLQKGELVLINDTTPEKIKQKRAKMRIPRLLRDE